MNCPYDASFYVSPAAQSAVRVLKVKGLSDLVVG
jgi:hypothetical protein